ncbi:MAG: type II secretion system protein GspN [Deltaproteobacteria bacterium]|nr:type II secretion system protein GspN [Deltaproteobacteria bacterium]MBW2019197.1 type II secretion system protein GspN [Deltaproteobacteria bacterium]MBW2074000.1 type II secretion system protein GspN [Deltaproteobacteria bacterium]
MSNYKKWLGYFLFVLILTTSLLYYRFPSDAVQDYLQAIVERADPRVALSIDRMEPWLPVGLKIMGTELAIKDMPDKIIFRADRLLLKPQLWSLLHGEAKYCFDCLAYNGGLRGYVKKDRTTDFIDTEIELKNIHIGNYIYLSDLIGHHIEGNLDGTILYKGRYSLLMDGSGEANLKLSNGRVELLQPLFTLESINFKEMEIKMVLRNQKINMTRLELNGEHFHGTLSGTITLKKEFAKSSIDLKGTIEPFAAFFKSTAGILDTVKFFKQRLNRGTLSFVIHGTLGEPRIKFT